MGFGAIGLAGNWLGGRCVDRGGLGLALVSAMTWLECRRRGVAGE